MIDNRRHVTVAEMSKFGHLSTERFAPDGLPFFTMEYVPGLPADRALRRGDRARLGYAAVQFALGLEALHEAGIVHGDLKPSNLMVVPGPLPDSLPSGVRLLDFGLARFEREATPGNRGTVGYAAPEVALGEPSGIASDLYGLGATLFAIASGRRPFEASSASGTLRLQQSGPPSSAPLEEAGLPAALVQLIMRLLSPTPGERGDNVREARRELERIFPAARRSLVDRLQSGRPVGRERELARLSGWLADDQTRVRLQIVTGAAGAGVSSVLDELAARAAIARRDVVRISGAMPAGGAARVLLRRLMGDLERAASGGVSVPGPLLEWLTADQGMLREADLEGFVEAAAAGFATGDREGGAPLVLIDDSHALDPVTRSLLRRLLLAPAGTRLRAVWGRHGTRATLASDERALISAGFGEALELGPLERPEVARLAAARLGSPAPEALVEWLWTRAAGHPGLTIELLRHAVGSGSIVDDEAGLRVVQSALESVPVPASFEASLLLRWSGLPAAFQSVASALAAWNHPVTIADLRAVEPRAETGALEILVLEGLAVRGANGTFAFSPPGLASRLLEGLNATARRELHEAVLATGRLGAAERFEHLSAVGRIAEALAEAEVAFAAFPDDRLALAAATLSEASAPTEAARWFERAGRASFQRARHAASVPMFERALALDPSGEARHARRAALAQALFRAGAIARVDLVVEEALADVPPPGFRAQILITAASAEMTHGRYESAERRLRETLALCERAGDDVESGTAAMSLAGALLRLGRAEEAEEIADRAVSCYRRAGHSRGALRALGLRASVAVQAGRFEEAQQRFAEALASAREGRERFVIEELLAERQVLWVDMGRWRAARDDMAETLQLALEDGRAGGAAIAMTTRAVLEGLTGRSRAARRHARAAVRMTRAAYPSMQAMARRALAQANRISGRLASAERLARRALSMPGAPAEERDWSRFELGRTLLASGRPDEARALLRDDEESQAVTTAGRAALMMLAGRAALRLGDAAAAERLLAGAEDWWKGRSRFYLGALATQLRAEIALVRGRTAEAATATREALEAFAELPAVADRAAAALDFARLCGADEDDARLPVDRWLEDAAAAFQRLGDRPARERSLAMLVRRLKRVRPTPDRAARAHDLIAAVRRLLDSLSDLRELAQRAMRLVVEQLEAERGVLLLVDGDSDQLIEMAEHGAVDASTRRNAVGYSRRVVERVARKGGVVLLGDAFSDPASLSESVLDMQLHSILCVPMFVGGRVVGAVYLDDSRRAHAFSDDDRALLEGFAQLMAVAFEKSRGHEEVERANRLLVGENIQLRQQAGMRFQTENLIATSSEMQRILAVVERVAHNDATVLLSGENGTGKEMVALTLHHAGKRHGRPFVPVNCGAIPEGLLEAELFGILPRVATGVEAREGRFVQANGGTLFLDEVADMPLQQQVALLRVLSSHEVTPVGGGPAIPIDVRIIAATNRDLTRQVEIGAFREDLYHRLNVIPIEIPPLRERKADIPALARHFVPQFAKQQQRVEPHLTPELLAALMQSDWPGNVRALQNYIERIMAMNPGTTLYPRPLPRDLETASAVRLTRGRTLATVVEELEQRMINESLTRAGGNQTAAARDLGLTEQSLRYRLRKYAMAKTRRIRRVRKK